MCCFADAARRGEASIFAGANFARAKTPSSVNSSIDESSLAAPIRPSSTTCVVVGCRNFSLLHNKCTDRSVRKIVAWLRDVSRYTAPKCIGGNSYFVKRKRKKKQNNIIPDRSVIKKQKRKEEEKDFSAIKFLSRCVSFLDSRVIPRLSFSFRLLFFFFFLYLLFSSFF